MTANKRRGFQKQRDQIRVAGETVTTRAAIYTRVSTEDQAITGFSLEGQMEKLRDYCRIREFKVVGEYVEQGGSGRSVKENERPQYVKMIRELEKWDVIVVLKMDRIHRSSKHFMEMIDLLRRKERDFVSITDNMDTSTAMGRFAADMIVRIAQLEVEQIAERTFFGQKAKIEGNGEARSALGQWSPFGYRWQCPGPHDQKPLKNDEGTVETRGPCPGGQLHKNAPAGSQLVVFDEEAKHVRTIFRLAAKGQSARAISLSLGWCECKPKVEHRRYKVKDRWVCAGPHPVLGPDGKTPRGDQCPGGIEHYSDIYGGKLVPGGVRLWEGTTLRGDCNGCLRVKYVLTNPAYLGTMISWGDKLYRSAHPALVDRKTFEAYNKRRQVPVILPRADDLK